MVEFVWGFIAAADQPREFEEYDCPRVPRPAYFKGGWAILGRRCCEVPSARGIRSGLRCSNREQ